MRKLEDDGGKFTNNFAVVQSYGRVFCRGSVLSNSLGSMEKMNDDK